MSYVLQNSWQVDQAILAEEEKEKVGVIRFGIYVICTESVICKTWSQSVICKICIPSVFSNSSPVRILQHAGKAYHFPAVVLNGRLV